MLVEAHAPGDAVHDEPEPTDRHWRTSSQMSRR
jgi:hypothetical protein